MWKPTGQYGKFILEQQVVICKYASPHNNQVAFCHCQMYMRSKGAWHLAGTYKNKNVKFLLKTMWPFIRKLAPTKISCYTVDLKPGSFLILVSMYISLPSLPE